MTNRAHTIWLALAVALGATACGGGMQVYTPTPARGVVIGSFQVLYGPNIPGDRQTLLNRHGMPLKMSNALRAAYPAGPGPDVRILITQFRAGRWGPTRMHATVQVIANGQVVHQFETDATTVNGSRGGKIRTVCQETVNQVAAQL